MASSYSPFERIFLDTNGTPSPDFSLPRRHDGDYEHALTELLDTYRRRIEKDIHCLPFDASIAANLSDLLKQEGEYLLNSLKETYLGRPGKAYRTFSEMMDELTPLVPLPRFRGISKPNEADQNIKLYRVRSNTDGRGYLRKDIFHSPASMRDSISTSRYSIAGYPSLYLADSLDLCFHELGSPQVAIAARFSFGKLGESRTIIDLGLRPLDLIQGRSFQNNEPSGSESPTYQSRYQESYLFWYPLIAACSFVRANPAGSFSEEYVIPQLLMQWLRLTGDPHLREGHPSPKELPPDPPLWKERRAIELLNSLTQGLDSARLSMTNKEAQHSSSYDWRGADRSLVDAKQALARLYQWAEESNSRLTSDFYENVQDLIRSIKLLLNSLEKSDDNRKVSVSDQAVCNMVHQLRNLSKRLSEFLPPTSSPKENKNKEQSDSPSNVLSRMKKNLDRMLKWLLWIDRTGTVGIRYFSCKDRFAPSLGKNFVFPTENLKLNGQGKACAEDYCSMLNNLFSWTVPHHLEDYRNIDGLKLALDSDHNLGKLGIP